MSRVGEVKKAGVDAGLQAKGPKGDGNNRKGGSRGAMEKI